MKIPPGGRVRAAITFENISAIVGKEGYLIDSVCAKSHEGPCFPVVIVQEVKAVSVSYCFGPALY